MKRYRKASWAGTILLVAVFFTGCKVSDDAIAASQQMTATAAELNTYYGALADAVTDTISLYELDGAISGIPFTSEERRLPEETRAELLRRKELALNLAALASAMATLTNSKAPADVQTAATALGNELINVKALPGSSPVPDAVGKAGNFLLEIVKEHEEKKAARAMDDTLAAIGNLFEKEKPTYDSIARTHIKQAGQVAKDLTEKRGVDPTPMLSPALKPFDLNPLPPSRELQTALQDLAKARLQSAIEQGAQREEAASDAMLAALREMSHRVHLLAEEKRMPIRGNPFSLEIVQSWAASAI